jgi:hypothetical protein
MWLKKLYKHFVTGASPVTCVFFVLSTGRCGTRYVTNLLNAAPNATVLHQPPPGCERINPIAYETFLENPQRYLHLRVEDFDLLLKHAQVYTSVATPVYGDCYNSIYPFAIALFHYFQNRGVDVKFIHLVRNPVACASSILRAEGPFGIGERKDFKTRAERLFTSAVPAEIAGEIWININLNIRYQMTFIEEKRPDTTRLVRLEDIQRQEQLPYIQELFQWLGLDFPGEARIYDVMQDEADEVRHSHQKRLDSLGIPSVRDDESARIKDITGPAAGEFGYSEHC